MGDYVEVGRLYKELMSNKRRQVDDSLLSISAPKLSDFYVPSEDKKIREYMFVAGDAIAGADIAFTFGGRALRAAKNQKRMIII